MMKSKLHIKNQNLPKGWRKVKLGDLTVPKGSVSGPFGSDIKSVYFRKEGVPIIRGNNLTINIEGGRYIDEDYIFLDPKIFEELKKSEALPEDIIITARGTIGQTGIIPKNSKYPKYVLSANQLRFRIDKSKADPLFVYYQISSKTMTQQMKNLSVNVGVPNFNLTTARSLELFIPEDINEQKRIADILSAFDEKIELNNKINQILEEMAQAIFKEWFVKFRFPDWQKVKFVNSELGKIPEGWRVGDLYELIEFEGGSQPPKEEHIYEKRPGYIRFIQNRDYTSDAHITYIEESKRNKICDEYDIMMDKYGEAGKVRFGLAGAYNVALAKITPKPPLMREYLRWFLKQPEIQQLIEGSAVASTRSSVNKLVFKNLKILLPPKRLMEKFEEIGRLYIENYLKIKAENQKLSTLRDLLLPKLMSGEIRV